MKKRTPFWFVMARAKERFGGGKMFLKLDGDSLDGVSFDFGQKGALRFHCLASAAIKAMLLGGRPVRLVRTECDSCGARPVVATGSGRRAAST